MDSIDPTSPAPAGLQTWAESPLQPGFVQNTTFYEMPNGAAVFSAGTISWAWGLDDIDLVNPPFAHSVSSDEMRTMTNNILDRLNYASKTSKAVLLRIP